MWSDVGSNYVQPVGAAGRCFSFISQASVAIASDVRGSKSPVEVTLTVLSNRFMSFTSFKHVFDWTASVSIKKMKDRKAARAHLGVAPLKIGAQAYSSVFFYVNFIPK